MTIQPILGAFFGGWELVLIFAVLLILAFGVGTVFIIIRAMQKKASVPAPKKAPPPLPPGSS